MDQNVLLSSHFLSSYFLLSSTTIPWPSIKDSQINQNIPRRSHMACDFP